jgi:hypothetical protein
MDTIGIRLPLKQIRDFSFSEQWAKTFLQAGAPWRKLHIQISGKIEQKYYFLWGYFLYTSV